MNWTKRLDQLIEYSFYALFIIVPLILFPSNYELFEFNKMLTVYFFTVVITAAWIIKMILQKKILIRRTPFDIPLMIFLASQILSTVFSIDRHTSIWGYYSRFHGGLASTVSYLILYYAFTSNISVENCKLKIKNCLKVILSTGLLVALYGILEHFGIDKHIWVQDVQNRVFSTLGQPNWLAAYLIMLIPLSWSLALNSKQARTSNCYFLLSLIYFITLLFTKSRSGLAGLVMAAAVFWGLLLLKNKLRSFPWKKFSLYFLVLACSTLIIGTDFTPSLKQIIVSRRQTAPVAPSSPANQSAAKAQPPAITLGGSKSSDIRKVVWQGAINIWRHYPVFGSGVETFAYSYYNFRPASHNLLSEWDFLYNKAHNEFLNFLATTGAFGLSSYLLIIIWFTIWTLKSLQIGNWELKTALLAGFLGLAVSNFFGFSVVPVALFFFLWPAFAFTLSHPLTKAGKQDKKNQLLSLTNIQYASIGLTALAGFYVIAGIINLWQADRRFNLGRNLVKANRIAEGYQYLQAAVKKSPREPLFRSDYAEAAAKMALIYQQQINQLPPELSDDQKLTLASQAAQLRNQMINQAISNSDLVISQNKVHLNYWKSRAKIFLYLSRIDPQYQQNALDALQSAISLSPTDPKLRYNLALLYNQMGQTTLAEQTLLQTIDLKPNYEAARFALGFLYEQLNQTDKAKQQYQYILNRLNPNNQKVKEKLKLL